MKFLAVFKIVLTLNASCEFFPMSSARKLGKNLNLRNKSSAVSIREVGNEQFDPSR